MRMIDRSAEALSLLAENKRAALTAMGLMATGKIIETMQGGYGRPIWQTGDLQRDVNGEVEASGKDTVDVGSSLFYAPFVHEGTSRMGGRPYIRDGVMGNAGEIFETAKSHLARGF